MPLVVGRLILNTCGSKINKKRITRWSKSGSSLLRVKAKNNNIKINFKLSYFNKKLKTETFRDLDNGSHICALSAQYGTLRVFLRKKIFRLVGYWHGNVDWTSHSCYTKFIKVAKLAQALGCDKPAFFSCCSKPATEASRNPEDRLTVPFCY